MSQIWLDKMVKYVLRREGFHAQQASDEGLYTSRREGGRALKSFRDIYDETKTRVACCMAISTVCWMQVTWENECRKEQITMKKEAKNVMKNIDA